MIQIKISITRLLMYSRRNRGETATEVKTGSKVGGVWAGSRHSECFTI